MITIKLLFHVSSLNLFCILLITSSRTSSMIAGKKWKWQIYHILRHEFYKYNNGLLSLET